LNSSVTLFGLDIYKEHFNKAANEKTVVKAGKSFGIILAILAMFIAPFIANAPAGLFGWLQEVNGCYSIPILTIIVIGFLTKYVPAKAAKIGLISGVVLYVISQFFLQPYFKNSALSAAEANGITEATELARIAGEAYPHFLHVMAILFVLNSIIMLVIGRIYPRKEAFIQNYTEQVDIDPWKYVKPVGAAVCVIVVLIYIYFSGE
jgi:SSS family solute:Na+ symporter